MSSLSKKPAILRRRSYPMDSLTVIATANYYRGKGEPSLVVGDRVRLNSGGPVLLIVHAEGGSIVAAWRADKVFEMTAPALCFHRVKFADDADV